MGVSTRYAIVRGEKVENVIELEEGAQWSPPAGTTIVQCGPDAGPGWFYVNQQWESPPGLETNPQEDLIEYAAKVRWETETGGIEVGNIPVHTDDRSKLMLMGARLEAMENPQIQKSWVGADGVVRNLTAGQLVALSNAVANHVSACFERYAEVKAAIEAGTVYTRSDVRIAFQSVGTPWFP